MMSDGLKPCVLEGRHVRLLPLSVEHLEGLSAVGLDPELWRWTTTQVLTPEAMREYVEIALDEQRRGVSLPFATTLKATGQIVGCTRFANIDAHNRRVEIGWTWVGTPWQRGPVNTEAKSLILVPAF